MMMTQQYDDRYRMAWMRCAMVVMVKRTRNSMEAAAEGQKFHCVFGT
jgi:hypothetical protein